MKKNFTLFFIYAAVILAGLCLFLVFHNKKGDETPPNNIQQEETEDNNSTDNDNNQDDSSDETTEDEEADNTIYATKLTLNCARTIDVSTNSNIEIVGAYLTLEPANANLNITITAESGNLNDLTFANNIITTKGKGKYRIKFSSPKSKTAELSDTLVVNVKENLTSLVSANLSVLTIGDTKNLTDVFDFDSAITNKIVQTDEKISYSNNILTANAIGESSITILYDVGMFRFKFTTTITIKDIPMYKIILTDMSSGAIINGNTIEYACEVGKTLHIVYSILNRDEEDVNQFVEIKLDNSTVATYVLTEPKIKVTCLSKGSVNLTIVCANDRDSTLTLTIKFV